MGKAQHLFVTLFFSLPAPPAASAANTDPADPAAEASALHPASPGRRSCRPAAGSHRTAYSSRRSSQHPQSPRTGRVF